MSYSPPREQSQTRHNTPELDLNDHRNQPERLPLAVDVHPSTRRGTLASLASNDRPRADQLELSEMHTHGSIARDFESAVIDDGRSFRSYKSRGSIRSKRSADEAWHAERRGSGAPVNVAARRSTFRRAVHNRQREAGGASRESSSDRSSSPPNSVDAFAPPRPRGRAGTVNSQVPSVDNLSVHRTLSNGTHSRRRPTNEEDGTAGRRTDVASVRSSVQEDVCFPPEQLPNTYTIDFEDLEEFVVRSHTKTPVAHPFTAHFHQREHKMRVFHDLRQTEGIHHYNPLGSMKEYFRSLEDAQKIEADTAEKCVEDCSAADLKYVPSNIEKQNRFTFFSSEIDETIHAPELGGLLMPGETFRDIFELGPEGGVWWLDMLNPTEEEIFAVCGAFRVHPLTREDITTQETREKVELFKSYYFVCFRSFYALDKKSEDYLEPINIYAVVCREGLLTFSFCQNPHAAHVRKRIGRLRDYVNLSADWICYALIDEIVDSFAPVLREIERETDTIEDSVFTARFEDSRAILQQIGECRKRVMSLLRLLGGKADVIRGFAKKCNDAYAVAPRGDVGLYLSDVQDHVVTMMSNLGHFEKMLSRSHSNHLSQISLHHIEQGSQANGLLGKITVFATVLVPLNLVAGLFGMNVNVPGKNAEGLSWWFGILGVMLGFALVFVAFAKKMKWV